MNDESKLAHEANKTSKNKYLGTLNRVHNETSTNNTENRIIN
jgi:hypothetical protein